jgi:hypothetical protein
MAGRLTRAEAADFLAEVFFLELVLALVLDFDLAFAIGSFLLGLADLIKRKRADSGCGNQPV